MNQTIPTPEAVAAQFCAVLREWLTPEQLAEAVRLNAERNDGSCATHDYCDANMAMDEAFARCGGPRATDTGRDLEEGEDRQLACMSDECLAVWEAAWSLAKQAGFKL